jgi:hypothetical protein
LRLAIEDLSQTYPETSQVYLERLNAIAPDDEASLTSLAREALLANPLLDFDRLLFIRRSEGNLGLSQNWESNSTLPRNGFDNAIMTLDLNDPQADPTTIFRPQTDVFVGDIDLEFDGNRMLFSMIGDDGRWQLFEMNADGTGLQQLPLITEPDVDNYDACYLPNGDVIFSSTAPFVGVPCVTGSSHVCNLYYWTRATGNIRRLTFEQDHNWCPTVLPSGRVLYLRWEYADIPHFVSRILFHMNPDGTSQMEYYGSNSYWPNAMFYARPLPGSSSKFVAIVGGHHDVPRMGELVVFDTAKGRHEADGVIQRIPGRGKKVDPIIRDGLVGDSWPKFLHPYPLSDKYFLVSAKPTPQSLWGIYLVDMFDNMTLIREEPGYALLEPMPFRATQRPPVIAPRVKPDTTEATVYMADVYAGPGLVDVPRGTVKALRLFTYHFSYHDVGGQVNRVGLDGPWDIKRVMGTVPVEEDGSALFNVPANTPISAQPLDDQGQAIQHMRSWMTAMPGEVLSCVGCHEQQNSTPPARETQAAQRAPSAIAEWYGPTRGFSFQREVQPVLDRLCIECHHSGPDGALPALQDAPTVPSAAPHPTYAYGSRFSPSYLELRRFLRAPTIESDMHLLPPYEFHASTSRLVRMLRAGHEEVALSDEDWDRINTWIDLGAPFHGTWGEIVGPDKVAEVRERRLAMAAKYEAFVPDDPEAVVNPYTPPELATRGAQRLWSAAATAAAFDPRQLTFTRFDGGKSGVAFRKTGADSHIVLGSARSHRALAERQLAQPHSKEASPRVQLCAALPNERDEIALPNGELLTLALVPAGAAQGLAFWMATTEITNAQYAAFDPSHDSRLEHGDFLQFSIEERGYPLNAPQQPVVRVTQQEAQAFCAWLSGISGASFALPNVEQWMRASEYSASVDPAAANLADASLLAIDTFAPWSLPYDAIPPWRPANADVNDGYRVSAPVASFPADARGLHDITGNVSEWVASPDGDTALALGGSWYDRPEEAGETGKKTYKPWQPVFDVGFRVICAAEERGVVP